MVVTDSIFLRKQSPHYFPKALPVCHNHVLHSRRNVQFIRTHLPLPNPTKGAGVSKTHHGHCPLHPQCSLFDNRHGVQPATVVRTREEPDHDVPKNPETKTPSFYFCPDASVVLRIMRVGRFSLDGHCGNRFPETVFRRKLPGLFPLLLRDLRVRYFDTIVGEVPPPVLPTHRKNPTSPQTLHPA
jgi:hypothetical protein